MKWETNYGGGTFRYKTNTVEILSFNFLFYLKVLMSKMGTESSTRKEKNKKKQTTNKERTQLEYLDEAIGVQSVIL